MQCRPPCSLTNHNHNRNNMGAASSSTRLFLPKKASSAAVVKTHLIDQKPEMLLNNLGKIGQVNVNSPQSIQTVHKQASTHSQHAVGIEAYNLSQLFDLRKGSSSPPMSAQIAVPFKIDSTLVERLASRYNSPSIGREVTRTLADGEQRTYREAIWVNPPYKQ